MCSKILLYVVVCSVIVGIVSVVIADTLFHGLIMYTLGGIVMLGLDFFDNKQ